MMWEIIKIIIMGAALASVWFWIAVLFRTTSPSRAYSEWLRIFVPQGIIIAWAIKLLDLLKW